MRGSSVTDTTPLGKLLPLIPAVMLAACAPAMAQIEAGPSVSPRTASTLPTPPPGQEAPATGEDEGVIRVTGQAHVMVPADQIRIDVAVETEGASANEATSENARRMDAVIQTLRGMNVEGLEIETFGYSLRPEYEVSRENRTTRTIVGYRAENNIRITFAELDRAGRILDGAVGAGANQIARLEFIASDTREARLEALEEAVRSAREQAEVMAAAMGVRLGRALEVQGGSSALAPREQRMMAFEAAEVATPIEAGDQMVSASVSITYRILEEGL